MTNIAIASDHAGFEYKEAIKSHLESKGIPVEDFGTHSTEPVDYPEFIRAAARAVADGQCTLGIILGGSGNEAIVANRIVGIRCAVVWNECTAQLSKEHGDCNMIGIGQRMRRYSKLMIKAIARVVGAIGLRSSIFERNLPMLDLNDVARFVHVVRSGNFAEAARRLGFPPNTVSRRPVVVLNHTGECWQAREKS